MKITFIIANIFLLGILVYIGFENLDAYEVYLMLCGYSMLIIVGILYSNNIFRNSTIKWILFSGYAISFIILIHLLVTEGDYIPDEEILVLYISLVALLINSVYVFKSKISGINIDKAYEIISDEKQKGIKDEGLWMRAVSLSKGNAQRTEGIYIKLRAKKISNYW